MILHVGRAHDIAYVAKRLAFHRETVCEIFREIPGGLGSRSSRILFFVRLVAVTAEQAGVLVGLEVRHTHDHRMRREGGCDGSNSLATRRTKKSRSVWYAAMASLTRLQRLASS